MMDNADKDNAGGAVRILLVEDDPSLAELLQEILTSEGYRITRAGTLLRARELLATEPHLILLDGILPDGDGLTLMDEIRSDPRHANRLILILSARSAPQDRAAGLITGADDYLAKPFDPDELIARVYALLRRDDRQCAEPLMRAVGPDHPV